MDPRLMQLDFAALHTLRVVHDQQSFTRAADHLGQTQSNVSYTIARLREVFQDPLFVREGGRTTPTARCEALIAALAAPLEGVAQAVADHPFDPARAEATVTLSCNHYERVTLLPGLIRHLRRVAPGLRLRSIGAGTAGGEQLKRGDCDLVIGPVPVQGDTVFRRTLRSERYVLVLDQAHPLAAGPLNVADFDGLAHVAISFAAEWQPIYENALRMRGVSLNTVVEVAEHGDIGGYVRGTDLAAIVPGRIAALFGPGLVQRELPFEVGFSVDLCWTARTHRAPLFQWVRGAVAGVAKDEGSPKKAPPSA